MGGSDQRIDVPLRLRAEDRSEHPALREGERDISFADLDRDASRVAARLRDAGVQPGDRVLLYARKSAATVAALYGIWRAGAIAIPASAELRRAQLVHLIRHGGVRLVLADPRLEPEVEGLAPHLPLPEVLEGAPAAGPSDAPGGDAPAAILYTSGSTGLPKGIAVSHANLLAGARIVSGYLGLGPEDRLLSVLPFHFDYGLNQLLTTVAQGSTLVLQRSTHPGAICQALEKERITGLAGVPPLWAQLFATGSPLGRMDLGALRFLTNSGGSFPVELIRRAKEALPNTRIVLMYGLSEAFRSTFLPPDELETRPTSMGKAIPETEVFVVNERGEECAPGEVGELVHRGPTVALGYWDDPEATARVFRPDPFGSGETVVFSGDRVKRDEEGYLYFVGRRDEQLKSYGHRVSPEEIEQALQASPLVQMAVVGGVPDPVAGDAIVAHVIPASDEVTEAEVRAYARGAMPRYMQPVRVVLHERFPRTASGKVDRRRLLSERPCP
ncbi:MAG TPA: AMP-binding protein [Polyangiaceae bacterium LLY-WYZ-15_(1-7)]|nr:AMP-dependent synthetase [Sandaracinus sp.]HJK94110.1 AMP-binding protein [Polyangiaceae bacterium LLY-WYZ-15_(1-7)]MBJ73595.1 AMP-dependent synthetase [Sandaracinus sp.]HJL05556.1 AMP-binding protein [Polyangiaceae bacterium LLY-WYZ-15_(1-7)]HJL10764.1 AMP-binding protein [Polyangiaceae bacterium LLY-WYZ-15_(1-7)]